MRETSEADRAQLFQRDRRGGGKDNNINSIKGVGNKTRDKREGTGGKFNEKN